MNTILYGIVISLGITINCTAQVTFQKTYGGFDAEWGNSIKKTSDGGYIVAGTTRSYGTGNYDFYLLKTDSVGTLEWTKTYGGTGNEFAHCVEETNEGGFILIGSTTSFGTNSQAIYIVKTDNTGSVEWSKIFQGNLTSDSGNSIIQLANDNFALTGSIHNDIFIALIDSDGELIWYNIINGEGGGTGGLKIISTNDDKLLVLYRKKWDETNVAKIDLLGNIIWNKDYKGSTTGFVGKSLVQTRDDNYVIVGSTGYDGSAEGFMILVKIDGNGDILWTKAFNDYGTTGNDLTETDNDDLVIVGTNGYWQHFDVVLLRLNETGNLIWSKRYGGSNDQQGYSIEKTPLEEFVVTGSNNNEVYIFKTDSEGVSGCAENIITLNSWTPAMSVSTETLTISNTGITTNAPTTLVGSGGSESVFCSTVSLLQNNVNNMIDVFPNPNTGNMFIKTDAVNVTSIEIYDATMRKVGFVASIIQSDKISIDMSELSNGSYYLKIETKNQSIIEKISVIK